MRARIRFEKTGQIKFVGHLDMVRYFQRAFRRADFDVEYSKGFSPHMIISFAVPLGVGMESRGEYFDIYLISSPSPNDAVKMLNAQMAEGIVVTDYLILPDSAGNAMAEVSAASYEVRFAEGMIKDGHIDKRIRDSVKRFYAESDEIIITKKTKKSERTLNLKPLIYDMYYDIAGGYFYMMLATGSVENIKPELVMEHLCAAMRLPYDRFMFSYMRTEVYTGNAEDGFRTLLNI